LPGACVVSVGLGVAEVDSVLDGLLDAPFVDVVDWLFVGVLDGFFVGLLEGFDDGLLVGLVDGVGVGEAAWAAGLTPGADRVALPFHENATYPPSGTVSPPAAVVA
jgi:hypothetical protein